MLEQAQIAAIDSSHPVADYPASAAYVGHRTRHQLAWDAVAAALWTVVAGLTAAYLVAFALSAWARLWFPTELGYGEAIVLEAARRVARGEPLYPPPNHLPLIVSAYMPLYYLVVGMLQRAFGDGYIVGRSVSLAATLGAAGLLAWAIRRSGGRWLGGALAAGLFLGQNMTVLLWAPLHRVDTLALCLTLAGLALAAAGRTRLAIVPIVLALLTKQSFVAAPIAICLMLLPAWRSAATFGGLIAIGVAAVLGLSQVLTDGWFIWYTAVANANPFQLDYLRAQLEPFVRFNALPLAAATALLCLRPRPGERIWRWYFVVSVLMLPGIGKVGASSNYWLELTAATAALIGLLAARLAVRPGWRAAFARTALAALLLAALLPVMPGYRAVVGEALDVLPSGGGGAIHDRLVLAPVLADEPGELLTDDPGLAVAAGKPVLFEFVIYRLLAEQGLWDERPILEAIAARRFELVALRASLDDPLADVEWTAAVRDSLQAAYAPVGHFQGYWFYRPVPLPDTELASTELR